MSKSKGLHDDVRVWLKSLVSYMVSRLPEIKYDYEIQTSGDLTTLRISLPLDQGVSPAMYRGVLSSGLTWFKGITSLPKLDLEVKEEGGSLVAKYLVDTSSQALGEASRLGLMEKLRTIMDEHGIIQWGRVAHRQYFNQLIKAKNEYQSKRLELQLEMIEISPTYKGLDPQVKEKIFRLVFPKGFRAE